MGLLERVADPDDPLRFMLQAALRWRIPPTVVLRERTVNTTEYTGADIDYVIALEVYEAGLCPGCHHPLAETSRPDHADAYRPDKPIHCHYCRAQALVSEVAEKKGDTAGLLFPLVLDADVVELNRRPVPPLPPELAALTPD